MQHTPTRFAELLGELIKAVAAFAIGRTLFIGFQVPANPHRPVYPVQQPARATFFYLLANRISAMARRFAALHARWRANTLPRRLAAPARSLAPAARTPPPHTLRPRTRFPNGRAWLIASIPGTANIASNLQHFLAQPDIEEFLRAAPQAGRILRPLCHMLGITELPPSLPLPPKPPRIRPRRVRPPRPVLPPMRPIYPSRKPRPSPFDIRKTAP